MANNRLTTAQTGLLLLLAAITACHMLPSVEAMTTGLCSRDSLDASYKLSSGAMLVNDANSHLVVMQWDCNLVLYEPRKNNAGLWSSQTSGRGDSCYATMQTDGRLAIYDGNNNFIWATDSMQTGSNADGCEFEAVIQDDANLVIYCTAGEYSTQTTHPIWSSDTTNQR